MLLPEDLLEYVPSKVPSRDLTRFGDDLEIPHQLLRSFEIYHVILSARVKDLFCLGSFIRKQEKGKNEDGDKHSSKEARNDFSIGIHVVLPD